jgi:hypothetical protein|tara:strand:+ start:1002 stop:1865 length:864 start_codon:yes stop_codon:yes gene_type:complete
MDDGFLDSHSIIKPPKDGFVNKIRKKRIIVDSRDRNTDRFPAPSKYDIKFDEEVNDVVSIEMINAVFPFNEYNVTSYNNILSIKRGNSQTDTVEQIFIEPGQYTPETLIHVINNNLLLQDICSFIYNQTTKKITARATDQLTIYCKDEQTVNYAEGVYISQYIPGSIGKILGLGVSDYTIRAASNFEFPFTMDFPTPPYIIMYLQRAKVLFSKNNKAHNAFAVIQDNMKNSDEERVKKNFYPPIANMSTLSFKFVDYFGNLYDFQNKEHRFELIVEECKQMPKYTIT